MRLFTQNGRVLLAVLDNPDMTQQEIADLLNMRIKHVWRALDYLLKEGILDKRREGRRSFYFPGKELYKIDDIRRLKACI